jgi:DNA-binding transcriptional ArsR family regulator
MQTATVVSTQARRQSRAKPDIEQLLDNARDASAFLKALSHETRLVILCLLVEGRKSVGELEDKLQLRQPVVSQQLARLRADNLVESERDGKNVYYSIARPEVVETIGALYRAFCAR